MKRLLYVCFAFILALTTASAFAADLTGDWTGNLETGDGSYPLIYHLKQDGAKITGNIEGPQGQPVTINDGKVDGDKLTFTVTYNGALIAHTGTVAADSIKIDTTGGDFGPASIVLKRSVTPPAPPAAAAPPASRASAF